MSTNVCRPFGQRPDGKLTISFFSAPALQVSETLIQWGNEVRRKYARHAPLPGLWHEFLAEYITPNTTIILAPKRGEWCAYIDNDRIGGMPFSELLIVPERLRGRSASFIIEDIRECKRNNTPYTAMFHYNDSTGGEPVERSVALICDGGRWEFHEHGTPLAFEEIDAYKSRKKADRFTPEMLVRYARALGIHLDQGDAFYDLSRAIGLKWHWVKSGDVEEERAPIKRIAAKIAQELGLKWKLTISPR